MVLGKICKYYQNSKCLYKGTYCDLFCNQTKYCEGNESDRLEEEMFYQEKSDSPRFQRKDIVIYI